MKPTNLLLLLLLTLSASAFAQSRANPVEINRIVAVVNDEAITALELQSRLAAVQRQLRSQNVQLPPPDVLEKQMLDRMIFDRVQLQQARETGLRISDIELDGALRRIAASNRLSIEEFRGALQRDGVTWTKFREDVRDEMTISRLREREVDARLTITEGEIDAYLANPTAVQTGNVEVQLSHIIVRVPEQATPDQLMRLGARANDALARVKRGEDFAKVAAAISEAPDALAGGDMGVRPLGRLPTLYADAIASLKPGETSDILRSPAGFHIVKLVAKGGARELPTTALKQTHARHILIKATEIVTPEEAQRKAEALHERLKGGADFAELARQHSNDFSAGSGGDLGWLYEGDTVPEFERAMNNLKIGETTGPVRTQFGFHLIQVMERRTQEATEDRKRQIVRQILRERRADEAYEDWLRQQRDRAYVDIRAKDA